MMVCTEADGRTTITPAEESISDEVVLIDDTAKRLLEKGSIRIIFDLSNVKYIGDSGMSLLIKIHRAACAKGGDVGIRGLRKELRKAFELTKLDRIFEIIPND